MEATSVDSARRLYERFRVLIHEGAKFGIVGLIGIVVNNLISHWMHYGMGAGTTAMSYLGNRYWSFRHRERAGVGRETAMFFVLNGVGLAIQSATVALVTHGLQMNSRVDYAIALNLGIVLGTLFRFWSYRKWVWAEPQAAPAAHEVLEPALAASGSGIGATGEEAGSQL